MRKEDLFNAIGDVDEMKVKQAGMAMQKKKSPIWIKWGTMAACLCVVVVGGVLFNSTFHNKVNNRVQQWGPSFSAAQYFSFCAQDGGASSQGSFVDSNAIIPYAESRSFKAARSALESSGVIPIIDTHPLFDATANYDDDGSLYSLVISWHRRDPEGQTQYSDLAVTAGYQEVPQIIDCIDVAIDENGNVIEPAVTVTERDGIQIVAEGRENERKTITFQNASGWYQISGSWNDGYEGVVSLLDWFWEHPIDFALFPMEAGDNYTIASLRDMPEAFSSELPDFRSFGLVLGESYVTLKNGEPVEVAAHYYTNITEEQAEAGEFIVGENGCTEVHWCLKAESDEYDLQGCIGKMEELTREQITGLTPPDSVTTQTRVQFSQGGYVVKVYAADTALVWDLIQTIHFNQG